MWVMLLKLQLQELNKEEVLENKRFRTIAIHGGLKDKNGNATDSLLTIQLNELLELLKNQSEIVIKYIADISDELESFKENERYVFFDDKSLPDALENALSVGKENILTAPDILAAKINLGKDRWLSRLAQSKKK